MMMSCALASVQAQQNSGTVIIDRDTASACEDAFDEVKAARPLIRDLQNENSILRTNLDLSQKLADSEGKRADAEHDRAEAERKRAEALDVALAAKDETIKAKDSQIKIRDDEVAFWKAKYKSERKGKFVAIAAAILAVASRLAF